MAVIEFINRPNKSPKSLKKVIEYILNPKKTKEQLIWGKDCNGDNAFIEMMAIKKSYGKETGRQYIHFVQSFAPYDKITPKIAYEIGKELCERFKDYQVVMATHIDRNHIHNHFVINSVNFETGYKWRQNPYRYRGYRYDSEIELYYFKIYTIIRSRVYFANL
ncbi:relaxase/mobilization nuclease domain-containing protein [Haloimpatiens lingqiaonensis]|uniref:relaxase/mobilization nuclease domain-containing protein n=1 Tax=Haloimpatiens lingqiaonensis TaxID=1380675 RepID=UPI0010FE2C38|nr:relaxase/mobilization nuclease domain-containing protein [Haloimpatiens lingqiaonensis]